MSYACHANQCANSLAQPIYSCQAVRTLHAEGTCRRRRQGSGTQLHFCIFLQVQCSPTARGHALGCDTCLELPYSSVKPHRRSAPARDWKVLQCFLEPACSNSSEDNCVRRLAWRCQSQYAAQHVGCRAKSPNQLRLGLHCICRSCRPVDHSCGI
jgi:hypothetical protein